MRYLFSLLFLFVVIFPLQTFSYSKSSLLAQTDLPIDNYKATLKETRTEAREAFKEKLAQIKDAKKRTITQNIDEGIAKTNERLTTRMSTTLTRLTSALDTAATTSSSLESNQAIETAEQALTTAQDAVSTQQKKEYIVTITDEATLRQTVQSTLRVFRQDIQATHKTVAAAREAVLKALRLSKQDSK